MENNVVIYQSNDGLVKMEAIVDASNETIWATQKAMAELFGVNVSGISRHLVNVFSSGELDEKSNLQKMQIAKSDKPVAFYSLDVIISVGYRVNSIRATAFRQWATSVLKQYMIKGYAVNQNAVSEQKYEDLKRDVFIFHCCIGCRVGDLLRLKKSDVIVGAIEYIATKTIADNARTVRVPLNATAFARYRTIEEDVKKSLVDILG